MCHHSLGGAHGAGGAHKGETYFTQDGVRKDLLECEGRGECGLQWRGVAVDSLGGTAFSAQYSSVAGHLISLHPDFIISKNGTNIMNLSWCRKVSERQQHT